MKKKQEPFVKFLAEIKKVTSRKTVSLDRVCQVVLETDDPTLMNLSAIDPDAMVEVSVRLP